MKFAEEEINLCKKLHELGVRKEIEQRDVLINIKTGKPRINYLRSKFIKQEKVYEKEFVLWTWADIKRELDNRGYPTWIVNIFWNKVEVWNFHYFEDVFKEKSLELCGLKILIKIAEKGRKDE